MPTAGGPRLLGFNTRGKIAPKGWRTTQLTPANEISLGTGQGFAVDCGRNNLVVIDPDSKAAVQTLADLWRKHEGTSRLRTYTVKTPRGWHFYFHAIPHVAIKNSVGRLGPNIDVRSDGGYVIAPPTPGYKVLHNAPIATLPQWIADLLLVKTVPSDGCGGEVLHNIGGILANVSQAQEGERNAQVFWAASRIAEMPVRRHRGAISMLLNVADDLGLSRAESNKTIRSAMRGAYV